MNSQTTDISFPQTSETVPHQQVFTTEEYHQRLHKVQGRMHEQKLDALIIHQPENLAWLSGVWHDGFFAYHALVVPQEGTPRLVMRALENPVADELSWIDERHLYFDGQDPLLFLQEAVESIAGKEASIGMEFDSQFLSIDLFQKIRKLLPKARFESSANIVEKLRQIKSAQELDYTRTAGKIASAAMAAGLEAVQEGVSELELAAIIGAAQARAGHDGFMGGMGGTICSGWRTQQLHAQQSDRILLPGDKFRFELGGIHKQYWAKQMRAGMIGPVSSAVLRATDILRTAQDDAISRMAPGVSAAEIADACRLPILKSGLAERYDNRVGYGLGIQFHPTSGDFSLDIDARSDYPLAPGMVFHMLLFAGGAAISETVAVTDTGHEILTSTPRKTFSR